MDDANLIQRAQAGDGDAWSDLVAIYQQPVFRLAYLLTRDPDEAEDVAQETLIRAYRFIATFDSRQPLCPWLLKITRNLALNRRRSWRRYLALLRRASGATVQAAPWGHPPQRTPVADEVWRALGHLDHRDQEVIYLRYFLELSVAETAAALAVAEGTVKSRLARALGRLRGVLQREFPEVVEEYAP